MYSSWQARLEELLTRHFLARTETTLRNAPDQANFQGRAVKIAVHCTILLVWGIGVARDNRRDLRIA